MKKQALPNRNYCTGNTEMKAFRIHRKLVEGMEDIAESKGWPLTQVVLQALDDYVSELNNGKKKNRR